MTLPLDVTSAVEYQRPPYMVNSFSTEIIHVVWDWMLAYLQFEGGCVFRPIIGAIDTRRTIRGIKTDAER